VPQTLPAFNLPPMEREASVQEALQSRPELTATLEKIRAAETRLGVAKNELMPTLNMVLEAYAHGLDDRFDAGNAFVNQFAQGGPGYTAGLVFEKPLGNAAAESRLRRRQLEARQLTFEFEATLKDITADVENAIRDVQAAQGETVGQHQAMLAAQAELDYLLGRWRMLPGEDRAISLVLDESLDALDRLVNAEGALAQAQMEYALMLIQYKRATGQLLRLEPIAAPQAGEPLVSRRRPEEREAYLPLRAMERQR
jgi:outer membrane protein TolC